MYIDRSHIDQRADLAQSPGPVWQSLVESPFHRRKHFPIYLLFMRGNSGPSLRLSAAKSRKTTWWLVPTYILKMAEGKYILEGHLLSKFKISVGGSVAPRFRQPCIPQGLRNRYVEYLAGLPKKYQKAPDIARLKANFTQ